MSISLVERREVLSVRNSCSNGPLFQVTVRFGMQPTFPQTRVTTTLELIIEMDTTPTVVMETPGIRVSFFGMARTLA